jgi:hypothetical protein
MWSNKSQSEENFEVDWKGMGLGECSYYNESGRSLGQTKPRSLTKLSARGKTSSKRQEEEEDHWQNAGWDHTDEVLSPRSPALKKTPGPLQAFSSFRRVTPRITISSEIDRSRKGRRTKKEAKSVKKEAKSEEDSGSLNGDKRPQALRRWSFDKSQNDFELLDSPQLVEQELLKKNERRKKRTGLKKKLLGNVFKPHHDSKNGSQSSGFLDRTEHASDLNSSSHREDDDNDELGSTSSSVAPSHKVKDEEVMLLLFRELESAGQ